MELKSEIDWPLIAIAALALLGGVFIGWAMGGVQCIGQARASSSPDKNRPKIVGPSEPAKG